MDKLYQDALSCIANWLQPWDLDAMSRVCKSWYRLLRSKKYKMLISFPFKPRYKLTQDQFKTLAAMMSAPREPPVELPSILDENFELIRAANNRQKFKLVHGEVGSGKTWLATAYVLRSYREELKCSLQREPTMYALVVVPPTCVAQWSEFFEKYTDLPVMSNYEPSVFYLDDWAKNLTKYGIIICSNVTSGRIQTMLGKKPHIILHDEAHNGITASYSEAVEVVGFTASIDSFFRNARQASYWTVFELKADALTADLPPMDFVTYEPCGYRPEDGEYVARFISEMKNYSAETIDTVIKALSVGFENLHPFSFSTREGKSLYYKNRHCIAEEYQAMFLSMAINIPKLREVVLVAQLVKSRKQKLVIFDINQDYIVPLTCLLEHFGLKVYPFCTQYNPAGRVKQLKKCEENGDVLIGSIEMLSEGHNITWANNILMFRFPKDPEAFLQAFGRCHRFPQKLVVSVHLIWSCALERSWALRAMEETFANIRAKRYQDELAEFYALYKKPETPILPTTVRRVHGTGATNLGRILASKDK